MLKAKIIRDRNGVFYGIRYQCPCGAPWCGIVTLPVNWRPAGESEESPHVQGRPHWTFNGDLERPVFGPSVLHRIDFWQGEGLPPKRECCHSFIGINGAQPGQIIFLGDCTHAFVGRTLELPAIED